MVSDTKDCEVSKPSRLDSERRSKKKMRVKKKKKKKRTKLRDLPGWWSWGGRRERKKVCLVWKEEGNETLPRGGRRVTFILSRRWWKSQMLGGQPIGILQNSETDMLCCAQYTDYTAQYSTVQYGGSHEPCRQGSIRGAWGGVCVSLCFPI